MKRKTQKILVTLLLLLAGICIAAYVGSQLKKESNNQIYDEIQEQIKEEPSGLETESKDDDKEQTVDFKELKKINPDIYAWIDIEDTNVHYPIVQSATDDTYYLDHTIEGKKGYPGSIYTEKVNAKDFSDFNTVIYGHEMKDETMFKHLHKFKDAEFFKKHEMITIRTETEVKNYRIYAAVIYDNRHILYSYDNDNVEERLKYIQSLSATAGKGSQFREDMTIDENSRLITLSTCITGQSEKRLIVVAAEI